MSTPIQLSLPGTVAIDALAWGAWSLVVGTVGARLPRSVVAVDTWLTQPRRWEGEGRWYERLGIRRWKDRLPEFGAFSGGRSKRRLPSGEGALGEFAADTRRAEYVHWAIFAAWPAFAAWNGGRLLVAMALYAAVANLPCIAIQRFNRLRIHRITFRTNATVPS